MNCKLCQKELDAYLEGKLPEGIRVQVKEHLTGCKECAEKYAFMLVSQKVINEEKKFQSNPFLSTRIMAGIEVLEQKHESFSIPVYRKALKPLLIGISIVIAIMIGVLEGDIYKPSYSPKIPAELVYMDDAALESTSMFSEQ